MKHTPYLIISVIFLLILPFSSMAIAADIVLDYDSAGQLTSIDYPGMDNTIWYAYDLSGNITEIERIGEGTTVVADSDFDGIDDDWELDIFGDLTTADASSDFDEDGYTDLQEYLNICNNELDPQGYAYDPEIANAPYGTGYYRSGAGTSFWNIMLPAILNSSR